MPDPEDFQPQEPDAQDLAEVFDEENITEDGRDIATSDLQRDVYDMTTAPQDANEALEPQDDFDPDQAGEAELEEVLLADEDLDVPRTFGRDNADLVADDDAGPAGMGSEDLAGAARAALDDSEDEQALRCDAAVERRLDRALEGTFPASDPVSISRRSA